MGYLNNEKIYSLIKRVAISAKRRIKNKTEYYFDVVNKKEISDKQRETVFNKEILFSIIVPVYNTPQKLLIDMVNSCICQTYENWELCIANASDEAHVYVDEILKNIEHHEPRVKHLNLNGNYGISDNTNEALSIAKGDFYVLLDHDDMLHESALYECMKVIECNNADMIYTDEMIFEDKISNVISIHHKHDFVHEELCCNNYICHMCAFSKELLSRTGSFNKMYDGSQDYDMILRLSEKADNIVHIPKVLYFWRSHSLSVAADISAKTYTIDAGAKAVGAHFERIGRKAIIVPNKEYPTVYKVNYEIECKPEVTLIIWGTKRCCISGDRLNNITDSAGKDVSNIILGGNINNKTICDSKYKIKMIEEPDYMEFIKKAINEIKSGYCILINGMPHMMSEGWIDEMLMYSQFNEYGVIGLKTLKDKNTIMDCGCKVIDKKIKRMYRNMHSRYCGYMMQNMYVQKRSIPSLEGICFKKENIDKVITDIQGDEPDNVMKNICISLENKGLTNLWIPYSVKIINEVKFCDGSN